MADTSVIDILKKAFLVGFLAGIISVFLGGLLGSFGGNPLGQLVIGFVMVVVLAVLARHVKIDEISVFDLVLLFAAITVVGSLIGMFVPQATTYILAVGDNLKVSGLLFTFLYIAIAELILVKIDKKLV